MKPERDWLGLAIEGGYCVGGCGLFFWLLGELVGGLLALGLLLVLAVLWVRRQARSATSPYSNKPDPDELVPDELVPDQPNPDPLRPASLQPRTSANTNVGSRER